MARIKTWRDCIVTAADWQSNPDTGIPALLDRYASEHPTQKPR